MKLIILNSKDRYRSQDLKKLEDAGAIFYEQKGNKLAEAYQIEDSNHGFEGKETKLVEIITDFLKRRVLI